MAQVIGFPGREPVPVRSRKSIEALDLTRRLQESGAGHLIAERLLGRVTLGSLFLGTDTRNNRQVTIKVIESDPGSDAGPGSIGNQDIEAAVGSPHVIASVSDPDTPRPMCYLSHYVPGESLRQFLGRAGKTLTLSEALRIAAEAAGALAHWHAENVAHGAIGLDSVSLQSGQIMVSLPQQSQSGLRARQRDIRQVAQLALDLWAQATPLGDAAVRWIAMHERLVAAADPASLTVLSPARLAGILRYWSGRAGRSERRQRALLHRLRALFRAR
jgi:hypothetical protein